MTTVQRLHILLIDDEPQFRQGLQTLLGFYTTNHALDLEVIGEAGSAEQALPLIKQYNPDLILLDLELVESDGITVLLHLPELGCTSKVLVLSGHQEDEWIFHAMQAGASGYVFKHRVGTQLFEAIKTILNSEVYLPPEVASGFFRLFQLYKESQRQAHQQLHLTAREREVLGWLAQGASNDEIAKYLYVTVATVKAHLTSIFEKLQVTSRTQAIIAAFKLGLVQPDETIQLKSQN
ncbi:response regulator transcription factor [Oculatella sp. LEGE 06141]|uniref:response regulator n=1 Tax=Oculatella sp. LEGE 06141 TaxID=1828648 RepID=UPI00187E71BF|nr:response regulator transcription factor [Oculatella sp. LEGE 06141]MBE9181991.1 response regulator transcription factor [Oculatella sp. LEGE 06141]